MIKGNLIIHSDFDFFSALMIIHGSAIREEGLQCGEIAMERAFLERCLYVTAACRLIWDSQHLNFV